MHKKNIVLILIVITLLISGCQTKDHSDDILEKVASNIVIEQKITSSYINMPRQIELVSITWETSDENVINLDGKVKRPRYEEGKKVVKLTATLTLNDKTKIIDFNVEVLALPLDDLEILKQVSEKIQIEKEIEEDISLPVKIDNVEIEWISSDPYYLSNLGEVKRPKFLEQDVNVILTAYLRLNNEFFETTFLVTIKANETSIQDRIDALYEQLVIEEHDYVIADLNLPTQINDIDIVWKSDNHSYLSNTGVVTRPTAETGDITVCLTASLIKDEFTREKVFLITIKAPTSYPLDMPIIGFAGNGMIDFNFKRGDPGYYIVDSEKSFLEALTAQNNSKYGTSAAKVIEITCDLNLGYHEVYEKYPNEVFNDTIFRTHNEPKCHPILMRTGVSKITIQDRKASTPKYGAGLMIFSKNGATIKHASLVIKRSESIIIRNLKFDELWEYDDSGQYDSNDWDYITLEAVNGAWIDHVTMGKAYDGLIDMKGNSANVSITWSLFETKRNQFIEEQFYDIEKNQHLYSKYQALRKMGLAVDDIIDLNSMQKKGHLIGANEQKPENDTLTLTLAYNHYVNLQDRLPRLRGGDAHVFNVIHDASDIYAIKQRLSQYGNLSITNQGIVTTENGAVLMEDSIFIGVSDPIRTNQKASQDSAYTGKYMIVNSLYQLGEFKQQSSSNDRNSIWHHSNSADAIKFSFNNFEVLPYHYELVPTRNLINYLNDYPVGASSFDVNWLLIKGE